MQERAKHRVIIDTNLWISFLLSREFDKIDYFIINESIDLLFSKELIDEFTEVAQRPKFKKYFALVDLMKLIAALKDNVEIVKVQSTVDFCRDSKDNFLLALAIDGQATHLLTGDKDLLVLKRVGRTKIMTLTSYLEMY